MKRFFIRIKQIVRKAILNLANIYFTIAGNKVECNICHYRANRFHSDRWHLYCICPYCSSSVHQRLFIASLSLLDDFNFDKITRNKKILHFAPEKSLSKIIKDTAKVYKTADFLAKGYSYDKIDYAIDISDMKTIRDESFNCVIACDVLEHVPDHIGGINEVYRILSKDGYCIFTVPQKDNLKNTFEDLSITDKKERLRVFGQYDHLRIYGDDFIDMLQNAGFEVTAVDKNFFDKHSAEYFVLSPPILSKHPLATNYRKVFFGRKTRQLQTGITSLFLFLFGICNELKRSFQIDCMVMSMP